MERLIILVGRPYKSVAPTKYFFKVPLVGRFMPLVSVIHRPVESPLRSRVYKTASIVCVTHKTGHINHQASIYARLYMKV